MNLLTRSVEFLKDAGVLVALALAALAIGNYLLVSGITWASQTSMVQVAVVDRETGEPIPNARVTLGLESGVTSDGGSVLLEPRFTKRVYAILRPIDWYEIVEDVEVSAPNYASARVSLKSLLGSARISSAHPIFKQGETIVFKLVKSTP